MVAARVIGRENAGVASSSGSSGECVVAVFSPTGRRAAVIFAVVVCNEVCSNPAAAWIKKGNRRYFPS